MASGPISKNTPKVYWISTLLLSLINILGIFVINSQTVPQGLQNLGLPYWFHIELKIGNLIGTLIILLPFFGKRIKEWAYVGLGLVYLSALIAHLAVDGINPISFTPLVVFTILLTSYSTYHTLKKEELKNLIRKSN